MANEEQAQLTVMVSSSVRHKEPMLDQIYGLLDGLGYKVWMSYRGTVPVIPGKSAFESCLVAAERCDLFFGIITPHYGSGVEDGELGITHRELEIAVAKGKPRFMLAHEQVVLARRLLMDFGIKTKNERDASGLTLKKGAVVIDDMRLIDMYELATMEHLDLKDRTDNWVQPYKTPPEALLYTKEQFGRYDDNVGFVEEWRAKQVAAL